MSGIECAFFGTLARDAEPKTSKAGKPYLRLSIRVGDGDNVQWASVLCFDPDAIAVVDKLLRGASAYVEGALSTNEYTGNDGVKRFGLTALSWHCRLARIGRQKVKRETEKVSVAAGETYASPRSAPGGRLEKPIEKPSDGGPGFHDDPVPFEMEVR